MGKSLVVFSGGQDSTTCLYWALNRGDEVEAITFSYGQKHAIELSQASKICKREGVKQTVVNLGFLDTLVESALTSNGDVNQINEKGLPASFVPNRNLLFITLAHAYAQKIKAERLVMGVCETDFSGYPDCRHAFINKAMLACNVGSDSNIRCDTPLMYLSKAQTFQLAKDENCLEHVLYDSHTCYNGDREHMHEWGFGCGECPACKLRETGWIKFKYNIEICTD